MTGDKRNPDCSAITDDILLSFTEGRLEEGLRTRVQAHLDGCEPCRIRAEEVGLIGGALAGDAQLSENIPVPERVDRAVFATISEVAGGRRRVRAMARTLRWLVPAAAVVVVIVIAGFLLTGRRESLEASSRRAEKSPPAIVTQREHSLRPDLPLEAPVPAQPPSAQPAADASESLKEQLRREIKEKERNAALLEEANKVVELLTLDANRLKAMLEAEKEKTTSLTEMLKKRDEFAWKLQQEISELNDIVSYMIRETEHLEALTVRLQKEKTELEKKLLITGDLNSDGKADVSDTMIIVNNLLSDGRIAFSPEGDANGDGGVDVGDALSILNKALSE